MLNSIFSLINSSHYKKGICVICLIVFRSLLDFAGITTVITLLFVLLKSESQALTGIFLFAGVLFIAIKNIFNIWIDTFCAGWFLSLYRFYSSLLLKSYYCRGLLYIKSRGSTALTHEVNSVCYTFVMSVLSSVAQIIGKLSFVFFLFIAFCIYSPYIALMFLVGMAMVIWVYTGFIRKRIVRYGENENKAKRKQWRNVQELYLGYVEVETNQAFGLLNSRFEAEMETISSCAKKIKQIQQIPPALLEMGMVLVLFALFFMAHSNSELIILLGVFTVAGMRIVPSIHAIVSCWTQIQNHCYTIDIISEAINGQHGFTLQNVPRQDVAFENKLTVERIRFAYPDDNSLVLEDFTMEIKKGEFVCIQGCSGIGKSTLVNLLLGFIQPGCGQVLIDEVPLSATNLQAWHRMIGYVPQEVFVINGTIAENIALGVKKEDVDIVRIKHILTQLNLAVWIDGLPLGLDTFLGENGCLMSGGQKQRIGIARALYKGSKVLFFDEATSALDLETEHDILQEIRRLSGHGCEITLLMVTHRQNSLFECDRIIRI